MKVRKETAKRVIEAAEEGGGFGRIMTKAFEYRANELFCVIDADKGQCLSIGLWIIRRMPIVDGRVQDGDEYVGIFGRDGTRL